MTTSPPGETPDRLVGKVLAGRYRILAKLGEGAMGAVYVGEHLHIGRRDAIKVLRPELAGDAESIARFVRGTRNVSAIHHPNVCTIYDFSDTPEGIRYLAMEFVEGETLKETLDREGRLSPARAVAIARQVAEALQAAHDVGVVHRDLKPGNIMLCRQPDGHERVKVVDFDIAKGPAEVEAAEVTRLGFVVGTPEYMSPEQLTGDPLDGRSDLYSLAVVLFRMLSGALPFRAASTQEIMVQRLTGEPLRLQEVAPDLAVPPALAQALMRALARRAADRPASAGEFARELTAALGGAPAAAPEQAHSRDLAATRVAPSAPPSAPARAPLPPRNRRYLVLAAAVVLLVLAAFAGRALYLGGRAPEGGASDAVRPQGSGGTLATVDTPAAAVSGPDTVELYGEPAADPVTVPGNVVPGGLQAMLDRQLAKLQDYPADAQLRAVRDSGELALRLAATGADSAGAAYVLAQAAALAGDDAACLRYARLAVRLGARAAEGLLQVCQ